MSSRTSFVLSSGVLLFLSLCSASYAYFTIADFGSKVSTCYKEYTEHEFGIALLQIQEHFELFDFFSDRAEIIKHFNDQKSKIFVDSCLMACYQFYILFNKMTSLQSVDLSVLKVVCICVRFRDTGHPKLQCDEIGNAVLNLDEQLVNKLFAEGDVDYSNTNNTEVAKMALECATKIKPLEGPQPGKY
uniref:Uncharacterized protein n=1 Tax=Cacopsylla melanoneura TaxID=428564 RepID=A0A8D9BZB1_9HEMI